MQFLVFEEREREHSVLLTKGIGLDRCSVVPIRDDKVTDGRERKRRKHRIHMLSAVFRMELSVLTRSFEIFFEGLHKISRFGEVAVQ